MQNLTIVLLQTDIHWKSPAKNRHAFEPSILKCEEQVNAICLPEMFTTGFHANPDSIAEEPNGSTVEWMHSMAQKTGKAISGSIIVKENNAFYNRFYWINPDHSEFQYDKKHLFAFGDEHLRYSQGKQRVIIPFMGWNIMPQICYDLRFPVWSRNKFMNDQYEYDMLLYSANWPASRAYQWRQLLIARAIENQCYVAAVNRIGTDGNQIDYSGGSMIIDPKGTIIAEASDNQSKMIAATMDCNTLQGLRERFPFAKDWDSYNLAP